MMRQKTEDIIVFWKVVDAGDSNQWRYRFLAVFQLEKLIFIDIAYEIINIVKLLLAWRVRNTVFNAQDGRVVGR